MGLCGCMSPNPYKNNNNNNNDKMMMIMKKKKKKTAGACIQFILLKFRSLLVCN